MSANASGTRPLKPGFRGSTLQAMPETLEDCGLDAASLPSVTRFLAELPAGLESYPDCAARHDVVMEAVAQLREQHPRGFSALADPFPPFHGWLADVPAVSLALAQRDLVFDTDEAWLDFVREAQARVNKKPMYRTVLKLLSPTLLLMSIGKRWATFRRGSTLQLQGLERGERIVATLELAYPAGLFPPLLIQAQRVRIEDVLRANGLKELDSEVIPVNASSTELRFAWKG